MRVLASLTTVALRNELVDAATWSPLCSAAPMRAQLEGEARHLVPPSQPRALAVEPAVLTILGDAVRLGGQCEVGGLLVGRRDDDAWRLTAFAALDNLATEPRSRFRFDPIAFAQAVAQTERRGLSWLGFAHSHPHGPAQPSAIDRVEAWRHCLQGIAAARTDGSFEVTFWWADEYGMHRVPFTVTAMELRP